MGLIWFKKIPTKTPKNKLKNSSNFCSRGRRQEIMQIVIWSIEFVFWWWPILGAGTAFLVFSSIRFLLNYLSHSPLEDRLSSLSKTMRLQILCFFFSQTEITRKEVVLTCLLNCSKDEVFVLTSLMQTWAEHPFSSTFTLNSSLIFCQLWVPILLFQYLFFLC